MIASKKILALKIFRFVFRSGSLSAWRVHNCTVLPGCFRLQQQSPLQQQPATVRHQYRSKYNVCVCQSLIFQSKKTTKEVKAMVFKRPYYITSQARQDWLFSPIIIVPAKEVEQVEPGECEAGAPLWLIDIQPELSHFIAAPPVCSRTLWSSPAVDIMPRFDVRALEDGG